MSTTTIYPGHVAWTDETNPTLNYNNTTFQAGVWSESGNKHRRGYARFTDTIPAGTITGMKFFAYGMNYYSPMPVEFYRITSTWDETTVTWNTAPSTTGTEWTSNNIPQATTEGWIEVDLGATLAENWRDAVWSNYGLEMRDTYSPSQPQYAVLHSDSGTNPPYFEIYYEDAASTATPITFKTI